ncbi:MAG: hypothetical protein COY66_05050 [Candidatus Kerfeldbacteria bacterium CG_4_10_14_0_8_um_filter_42_10]|uniref:Zeta toxin domain-containing protein n=1 Tax=Candidatus Kerfeldbacteria bacterium CG_4_10_14_0_8_um_filter_42_10 TaxID=2014248 RepID=A0A2M7RH87_9BACT|nr:MAG: hypothetical protein COY66_05050 [Candidatus Kerfeldbacteria bacterium CG_4_10_14_0_8_um_filter_42_10]
MPINWNNSSSEEKKKKRQGLDWESIKAPEQITQTPQPQETQEPQVQDNQTNNQPVAEQPQKKSSIFSKAVGAIENVAKDVVEFYRPPTKNNPNAGLVQKVPKALNDVIFGSIGYVAGGIASILASPINMALGVFKGQKPVEIMDELYKNINDTGKFGKGLFQQAIPGTAEFISGGVPFVKGVMGLAQGVTLENGKIGYDINKGENLQTALYDNSFQKIKGLLAIAGKPANDQEIHYTLNTPLGALAAGGAIALDLYFLGKLGVEIGGSGKNLLGKNYRLINSAEIAPPKTVLTPEGQEVVIPTRSVKDISGFKSTGLYEKSEFKNIDTYLNLDKYLNETSVGAKMLDGDTIKGKAPVNILRITPTDKGTTRIDYFRNQYLWDNWGKTKYNIDPAVKEYTGAEVNPKLVEAVKQAQNSTPPDQTFDLKTKSMIINKPVNADDFLKPVAVADFTPKIIEPLPPVRNLSEITKKNTADLVKGQDVYHPELGKFTITDISNNPRVINGKLTKENIITIKNSDGDTFDVAPDELIGFKAVNKNLNLADLTPKAILTFGPPASGKSTIIEQMQGNKDFIKIDPDNYIKELMKNNKINTPDEAHNLASQVAKEEFKKVVTSGKNVVYVGSGSSIEKYQAFLDILKNKGYNVEARVAEIPKQLSRQRTIKRNLAADRGVPVSVVDQDYDNVFSNLQELSNQFGNVKYYDTTGKQPRLKKEIFGRGDKAGDQRGSRGRSVQSLSGTGGRKVSQNKQAVTKPPKNPKADNGGFNVEKKSNLIELKEGKVKLNIEEKLSKTIDERIKELEKYCK